MPIKWSVVIGEELYDAYLAFPEEDAPPVDVPGYDLEVAIGMEALGAEMPVVDLLVEWGRGPYYFLAQKDNLEEFVSRLTYSKGGELENLISLLSAQDRLSDMLAGAARLLLNSSHRELSEQRNPLTLAGFFKIVEKLNFGGVTATDIKWGGGDELIADVMVRAFKDLDFELWNLAKKHYKGGFGEAIEILEDDPNCTHRSEVSTTCTQDLTVVVFGEPAETWTTIGRWQFDDEYLEEWVFFLDKDSDAPWMETEEFLERVGEDTNWEERVKSSTEYKAAKPEVPSPDGAGDYAVFVDSQFLGRYLFPSDAERFAELSTMAGEGMWEARAYELDTSAMEDDAFDEEDIDNYIEI